MVEHPHVGEVYGASQVCQLVRVLRTSKNIHFGSYYRPQRINQIVFDVLPAAIIFTLGRQVSAAINYCRALDPRQHRPLVYAGPLLGEQDLPSKAFHGQLGAIRHDQYHGDEEYLQRHGDLGFHQPFH
eukprot:9017689-Pyramimonas_sp.AAC.1